MTQRDFTRFGRNSIEVGYFMERVFPLYGVRFISLNDDFDSDKLHGDTGGINVAFKYLVSEFYSRDLSIKYKSAKYVKFRRGEYQSTLCPYGYRKGADGRLEPDEETAPNVLLIFELAASGMSNTQIINELFARGIPTPAEYKATKGRNHHDISRCRGIWIRSTIIRLTQDERYTGCYIIGKRQVIEVGGSRMRIKDESEWIKIPNHHTPIISKELFDKVQAQMTHFKCPKKKESQYPLRTKVFCGCCRHAMTRTSNKNRTFGCSYTLADKSAPCYRLKIAETELDQMIYGILSKQAQIILNIGDLSDTSQLDVQSAKQAECCGQIDSCLDKKRVLYEQLVQGNLNTDEYKIQKAMIDCELERLRKICSQLNTETAQMKMDEKAQAARIELAKEIVKSNGMTADLADALIKQVYVYPNNQIEIVWKIKDFCMEEV